MTNAEIIVTNMAMLIADNVISTENTINTYLGWKMRGYKIKKGEQHIAEFPIWVKSKKKKQQETEEQPADTEEQPKKKYREFVLQKAYWFTDEQVEPIKKQKQWTGKIPVHF